MHGTAVVPETKCGRSHWRKNMKLTKLLTITAAVLLALLVAQVSQGPHAQGRSRPTTCAMWRFDPPGFVTAARLADFVVRGHVTTVVPNEPRLQTLTPLPGEVRDGLDIVTYDAVTLQVVNVDDPRTNRPTFSLPIERVGGGSLAVPGPNGLPVLLAPLEDNPPYVGPEGEKPGEEYFLFLLKCAEFKEPEQQYMVMGAKGRFQVVNDTVVPTVPEGRSQWIDQQIRGIKPAAFENLIRAARQLP
jgi:hypothetical protein